MGWPFRAKEFTWEDYLAFLPQLRHVSAGRPALVLPWIQDGLEDWPSALARGRRLVEAMSREERLEPIRITSAARERIGAACGTRPIDVERLLAHYQAVRERVQQYQSLSLWQRIKDGYERIALAGVGRG